MTAILYRSNLSSSKYYHLVEKCLNSIPEICDDLRGEYGVMNEMPDLSYEHLMSAHAAGCVGRSFQRRPRLLRVKSPARDFRGQLRHDKILWKLQYFKCSF